MRDTVFTEGGLVMLKRSVWTAGIASAAVGLATFAAVSGGAGETERADCPGKIVCPITGELVCKDKCPLNESAETKAASALPACCRGDG